jgi:hypothetical protein
MVALVMEISSTIGKTRIVVPMDDLHEISQNVAFEGKVMSCYDNLDRA